jgi:hypothetical protein
MVITTVHFIANKIGVACNSQIPHGVSSYHPLQKNVKGNKEYKKTRLHLMRPTLYRRCSGGELDRHEQPAVPGRPPAAQPPRHRHLRQLCGLHARHRHRGRASQDDGGHARRRYSLPRLPHNLVTSLPQTMFRID